ncbi:MAG: tetratricopeptide repeat protein [Candidatus Cloacimonadota bacterium]|nr:tetratricopeptide repeat protein [Candidatus Cloacimonadota bacterium]
MKKILPLLIISIICFGGLMAQDETKNEVKKVLQDKEKMQTLHQYFSATCFNNCWKFIEKSELSAEDVENMIVLSNASLYHWKQREDCTPQNLSIAYWQLGRVYVLAKELDIAKDYSQKCIDISLKNELSPFYIGYGYEAMARTLAKQKDYDQAKLYLQKGYAELNEVTDKEDKKYLKTDLDNIREMIQ